VICTDCILADNKFQFDYHIYDSTFVPLYLLFGSECKPLASKDPSS
jgi:hypothetical protein